MGIYGNLISMEAWENVQYHESGNANQSMIWLSSMFAALRKLVAIRAARVK